MAERNGKEDFNQIKNSSEKRRLNKRKNQLQEKLMEGRNLFTKTNGEEMNQNHKPQEDKEDIILDFKKEDPGVIKGLDLTKHYKKRKKSKKRCWICRTPPSLRTDAHI